jgi:DNA-binding transcriptional regulator YhcF (GntR family)
MPMAPIAAQDVVSYVIDRLATGLYPPGGRLPTSRELAAELGVHRNTVAKAYKSLVELGLITSTPGRGTFAAARIDLDPRGLYDAHLSDRLADAILRARRGNVREDELRKTIERHIAAIYHAPPARGAFVECNTADLRVAVTEIAQQTDVALAPVLLEALAADPAGGRGATTSSSPASFTCWKCATCSARHGRGARSSASTPSRMNGD